MFLSLLVWTEVVGTSPRLIAQVTQRLSNLTNSVRDAAERLDTGPSRLITFLINGRKREAGVSLTIMPI